MQFLLQFIRPPAEGRFALHENLTAIERKEGAVTNFYLSTALHYKKESVRIKVVEYIWGGENYVGQ